MGDYSGSIGSYSYHNNLASRYVRLSAPGADSSAAAPADSSEEVEVQQAGIGIGLLALGALLLSGCTAVGGWMAGNVESPDGGGDADGDGDGDVDVDGDVDADGDYEMDADGDFCANPPEEFNLTTPTNGALSVPLNVLFEWQASFNRDAGDLITYLLMIDTEESFSDPEIYPPVETNQSRLPELLLPNTQYYWRVIAQDLCEQETLSDEVFSFRTIAECSAFPEDFSITSPADGSDPESVTPTFVWSATTDPDSEDTVRYRLEIDTDGSFSSPLTFDAREATTYTLQNSEALEFSTEYFWRVVAIDGCGNEKLSTEAYSFTTRLECVPQAPIIETDFVDGVIDQTDNDTTPGSLILSRAWTAEWRVSSGLTPDAVIPGMTLVNSGSGTAEITDDPVTFQSALRILSDGSNPIYYSIDPAGLSNQTGWAIEALVRLHSSAASGEALDCGFEVRDYGGVLGKRLLLDIRETGLRQVVDTPFDSDPITTTDNIHSYLITGINDDFLVEIDGGSSVMDGTDQMTFGVGQDRIYFGNIFGYDLSDSYWYIFRYYAGGNTVPPYHSSGNYEVIYDLGSVENNLGTGAYIISDPADDTDIHIETRSGNPTTAGDSCGDPITWLNDWREISAFGGTIDAITTAARCLGVRVALSSDGSYTPEILQYSVNYCRRDP